MRILSWLPRLRAGVPAGAAGHWRPQLSLAFSTAASALHLNRRQWLLVVGVFLAFMFLIVPVIYAVRVFMDKLEKAELELERMCTSTPKADDSHRSRCRVVGSSSVKHGSAASSTSSPRASPRPAAARPAPEAEGRVIPEGDELDMAVPGASQEPADWPQSPPRMAASAPIGARDAEERPGAAAAAQPWPSPRSWPGSEPGVQAGGEASRRSSAASGPSLDAADHRPDAHHAHHSHHHASRLFGTRGVLTRMSSGHGGALESPRPPELPEDLDAGDDNDWHTVEGADIVEDMGISGMCLVCSGKQMRTVVLIAGQAFVLQALILYYISTALEPHPRFNAQKALPVSIVYAAIYLQFIVVVKDLPRSMFVARWFHEFHDKWLETAVFGFIFVVDAFVIPLAQLFIGALFLCTSVTIVDVLMNSFALSYISSIDNMILEMRKTLTELSSDSEEYGDVTFPVNPGIIRAMTTAIVIVPVIPVTFSFTMAFLGLKVFML